MNWVNATVAVAVVLTIGASNAVTWAVTRLRNACDHYTARHASSGEQTNVQEIPEELSALMDDPAGATRPDIRWELTS